MCDYSLQSIKSRVAGKELSIFRRSTRENYRVK
jgi:hypothetical protein